MMFIVTAMLRVKPLYANGLTQIWYIKAEANGDGKTSSNPIGSSALLEQVSKEGDTIFLLSSDVALKGGLRLKKGQKLIGLSESGQKPIITNSDATLNGGCGVVLASENYIVNLRIENTYASGVYAPKASGIRIDKVEVRRANLSKSFTNTKYPVLPGSLPHGGMIFVHSDASAKVLVTSSIVNHSAGFGIASIVSDYENSQLTVSDTRVEGGTRIGFFDAGITALVRGPHASIRLNVNKSEVQGRLSRSGRNIMVVASGGAKANASIEQFISGPTGQDGIVAAVMQSPSEIDIFISDSIIEGAGQMNIEGTLVNLPPEELSAANQGKVSIVIENSVIRNAGAVAGFEDVAANVWLGPSQFIKDSLPAVGEYYLKITGTRIEGAGRSGLEFGDHELLTKGQSEKSEYKVVLSDNTIFNNGKAEIMIYAPQTHINAQRNCWGQPGGLANERVIILPPVDINQLDVTFPISCVEVEQKNN